MHEAETIDQVLDAFLAEQRKRLSDRTCRNYRDVTGCCVTASIAMATYR